MQVIVRLSALKGESVCECESNVKDFVFTSSLPAFEGDCLYTKFTLYFILVRMYSLLLCSSFCLWLEKK